MFKRISRFAITILGAFCGMLLAEFIEGKKYFGIEILVSNVLVKSAFAVALVIIGTLVGFLLSKLVTASLTKLGEKIDSWQADKSIYDLFIICIALGLGLVFAFLLSNITKNIPGKVLPLVANVVIYLFLPYIFARIIWKRREDIPISFGLKKKEQKMKKSHATLVFLDTSAIIDGRVFDLYKIGFLEGQLAVAAFTIMELNRLADNEDATKRSRGRRGLDLLKQMQDEPQTDIVLKEIDYTDITDIDMKLVRLALDTGSKIVTTDYNLSKTASINKVKALNINEIANALKNVLIPGEKLSVRIIKEGKEENQGVAYLPDGTMIVVENGRDMIGETCDICVTTVLQTAAGRMIFAKVD